MRRKVLVTGASGFIGQRLVQSLARSGYDVVAVASPRTRSSAPLSNTMRGVTPTFCDLRYRDDVQALVREQEPDTIVNLAVARSADRAEIWAVNHDGTAHIISAALERNIHVVHAGSSAEYGPTDVAGIASESQTPVGTHGKAKRAATMLVSDGVRTNTLDAVVLRPFLVYGPGERPHRFLPQVIAAARSGTPLRITATASSRDYVHVDDIVEAFMVAIAQQAVSATPVDLCTGISTTNEQLVAVVEAAMGVNIQVSQDVFPARAWDRASWVGDPVPLTRLLGRQPVQLSRGIAAMVESSTAATQ